MATNEELILMNENDMIKPVLSSASGIASSSSSVSTISSKSSAVSSNIDAESSTVGAIASSSSVASSTIALDSSTQASYISSLSSERQPEWFDLLDISVQTGIVEFIHRRSSDVENCVEQIQSEFGLTYDQAVQIVDYCPPSSLVTDTSSETYEEETDISSIINFGEEDKSITYEGKIACPQFYGGWTIGQELGRGAFAFTHEATCQYFRPTKACAKLIKATTCPFRMRIQQEELKTEINILYHLTMVNHPNLIRLYCASEREYFQYDDGVGFQTCYCMILELAEGGTLFDILFYTGQFDEQLSRYFFKQLVSGCKALHGSNIAHRDFKPTNILFTANFQIKIIDFGSAAILKPGVPMKGRHVGTKGYQAPEILAEIPYTRKCDVFSLGIVLFVMLFRCMPFKEARQGQKPYKYIVQKKYSKFWQRYCGTPISNDCKDILEKCFCFIHSERYDIDQLISHPWLNKHEDLDYSQLQAKMAELRAKAMTTKRHLQIKEEQRSGISSSAYDEISTSYESNRADGDREYPSIPPALKFFSPKVNTDPLVVLFSLRDFITSELFGQCEINESEASMTALIESTINKKPAAAAFRIQGFQDEEELYYINFKHTRCKEESHPLLMRVQKTLDNFLTSAFVMEAPSFTKPTAMVIGEKETCL